MANNQIRFNVGFNIDRTGLNELQNSLAQVQLAASRATGTSQMEQDLRAAGQAASQLSDILNQSWNSRLGQLDLSRVNNSIKQTYGSVSNLKTQMERSGPAGAAAYNQVASAILNTNLQLKQSNKLLDEMALSMANTVKWGITSNIFNNITNSIQKAYGYTKRLDTSLNDIRIVTDKSAESMEKFAVQANEAAKGLGASTMDYTQASLIYYQQGLDDTEVAARAETTLKAANVTGQTGAEVSEQLTAVWNGYKVTAEETELYVDKLAAVAATTASDLEELSVGMSKVASAANIMGVDIDQLNAQLSTIVSVTREAPESIGTALKTVYARMSDITAGMDSEVSLDEYTQQMAQMGINALDANDNLRDMGEVIEEIGGKWTTLTREQQTSLAQTIAGTRQYSRMMSLFDNWDMYTKALETSSNAAGTLQKQQDIYMESTEAHLQKLSTEAEKTYDILFDQDTVNGFADALTGVLGVFNNFIEGVGGGAQSFVVLGSIIANIFSKQIGNAFNNQLANMQRARDNADALALKQQVIDAHALQGNNIRSDAALNTEVEIAQRLLSVRESLSSEEYNRLTTLQQEVGIRESEIEYLSRYEDIAMEIFDTERATVQDFEDRLRLEEASVREHEDRLSFLDRELNIYERLQNDENYTLDDSEDLHNRILGLQALAETEEDSNILREAAENIASRQNVTEEQRRVIINTQNNLLEEQRRSLNLVRQGTEGVRAAQNGTLANLREESNTRQRIINQQIAQAQQQQTIQQAVQGATALVSIGMSLIGVIQTLNDESLSLSEKATQITTVLLFSLPMIINNFNSIKAILPGIKIALTQMVATYGTGQAAISASNALIAGSNLSLGASISALLPVLGGLLATIAPYVAIVAAVVGVTWLAVKAYNADAEAAKKAAEAHREAAEAAQEAKAAYEELADTISEYKELVDGIEELDRSTQEYKDSLEQANEKAMELIRSNKELAQYAKRNDQGLITFEGNEDKVDEILKQGKRKKDLALGAESLAEIEANKAQLKSDTTDFMRSTNISFTSSESDYNSYILEGEPLQKLINEIAKSDLNGLTKDDLASMNSINDLGLNGEEKDNLISAILAIEPEIMDIAEQTRAINATESLLLKDTLAKGLEDSEKYTELNEAEKNAVVEIYGNEEKLTEEVKNDIKEKAEKKIEEDYKDGIFGTGKETELHDAYAKARGWELSKNKAGDKAIYVDEEGNEHTIDDDSARTYLKNLEYTDLLADYDEKLKESAISVVEKISNFGEGVFNEQTASELLGFANGKDVEFNANTMSLETFNKLQEMSTNGGIEEALSGVTADEWDALGYENAKVYAAAINKALTPELKKSIIESAEKSVIELSDDISSLTKAFQSGDITSENIEENEEYQNIIKNLEKVKTLYPELTVAAETFANTNLVGTQMWSESLYQLQDAINEIELNDLKKKFNEAKDAIYTDEEGNKVEFEAWLNSDEFKDELDAILNADYAINIEIHSQAEEYFDSTASAIENIKEQAGKIGDSFIVAGEDIRELNNAFPGILEGMENLHDGTVKLNKEVVKSAMDSAKAEVVADSEKTNEKLQNSANELRAKQKTYQAIADAAFALADAEIDSEEETGKYKQTIEEGLSKLNKETADIEMENDASVATNSNENAGILAENWNNAYQKAADSATEFAKVAVSAHKAAEEGNEDLLQKGDFNIVYSGRGGVSSEAKQIEKYQDLFNEGGKENYAKIADAFQAAADAAGKQANDIEGMMKESEIATEGILKGLKGVAAGRGIDDKVDGGDKDKRDEEYKNKDEEIDRYWELNEVIKTIEESISDLDKKQSKLHGKELIASLRQENELLEQQAEAYKALAAEQQKEASELQAVLSTYGVIFDAQGGIANYLAASQSALEIYNQAVAAYNAFLIDEATFQAAQRAYDNFKSQLERYEALYYEEMVDTQNKLDDIRTKELENNLEAWETEIQIQLDLSQAERDWNDFLKEINEDFKAYYKDIGAELNNLLANATTYTVDNGTIEADIKAMKEVMAEIDKFKNGGTSDMFSSMSEAQEKLKELIQTTQDDATALYDIYQNAWDAFMQGIDQSAEKFDDLMGQFERIDNNLEYQRELIELLYGEEAYRLFDNLYKAQEKNSLAQIDSLKQQKDMWYKMWQSAEEGSAERAKYYDLMVDAEDKLNSKVVEHIKLLKDDYANTVDGILKNLETNLTGGKSIEEISEEWDRITEKSDKYLDNVEGLYEIQTLANKISNSIAETSSLKNQQKLQKLYDKEIDYLREKEDLTKYDLEAAEARYQIALKEIALEDARNAKNSMKLTRGTDGNWSYQYVADEEAISDAQQSLLDASHNLYQLANDAYQENLKNLIDLEQNYLESYRKILEDENLSNEERDKKLRILADNYYKDYEILAKENALYRDDLAKSSAGLLLSIYKTDEESLSGMTSRERELVMNLTKNNITDYQGVETAVTNNYDGIRTKADEVMSETLEEWTSGAQFIADAWNADDGESVKAQVTQAHEEISRAADEYQQKVDDVATTVGQDFSEDGIAGAIGDAKTATEELEDATDDLISNTINELDEYESALREIAGAWDLVKDSITKSIEEARKYAYEITSIKTTPLPSVSPNTNAVGSQSGFNVSGQSSNSSSGGGTSTSKGSTGSKKSVQVQLFASPTGGVNLIGTRSFTSDDTTEASPSYPKYGQPYRATVDGTSGYISSIDRQKVRNVFGFATGGYTGDWEGKDGKLAFLHSKELVLNSEDTKNILDAVNTVRSLSNLSSSIEDMIAKNLNNMIMKMSNIGINSSYNVNKEEKNMTKNIFHVTAEFPNANDVNSIKEAFLSLPNIVSQYIAENKK